MNIFERMRRIAEASIHDSLDKAESPEKMLKQKVRELEDAIKEAKDALASFAVSFKKTEKEQEQLKRLKAEWEHKAEASLAVGDEAMARNALSEKLKADERIRSLEPSINKSKETYAQLREGLVTFQDQLREAKLQLTELQSRKRAAEAQKLFGDNLEKGGSSVDSAEFSKMEEDVLKTESEAEISGELRGDSLLSDADIEKKTRELQVDSELDALRSKLKKKK